ncbi:MAG: ATP-dependent zinc metalloprotease FtsH [Bacteroidales bacterium]|nr:ATP-dependent zinc metalloprotease FtsH [Bacteroidales bacterium]MCF8458513.1 ATP-dependent zinc metalloprotease FtsH [Bacteroidales bacterium]
MTEENKNTSKQDNKTDNKPDNKPGFFKNQMQGGKSGKPKFNIYWVYGLIAIAIFALQFLNYGGGPKETNWGKLKNVMLENHDVDKILIVNGKKAEIYIKKDRLQSGRYEELFSGGTTVVPGGPQYVMTVVSVESFERRLEELQSELPEEQKIYPGAEERKDYISETLSWLLPIIILVAVWLFLFRRMSGAGGGGPGGIFNVGKSKAQLFDKESNSKIDFSDVAGLEEAKTEIKEIVEFLKNPEKYTDLGGKIPKGALLVGPPGTGKTLLAKAVAGEAHVPFFSMSGSDFVEMFVGVGASRVRDLFKQAKEKAPCIIFIDEIDAIGRARGRNPNMGANDERENTLNQLLTEMDGFGTNVGVIILAATNRADILDRALLRAGRFDRQIHVELPDLHERADIFKVHLQPIKYDKDNLDPEFFAKQTPGFSGADIANVCNESALIAARKGKKLVEKQDFLDAVDRIIGGLEKKNKIITMHEKKTIAFHEAGHATVSWLLEYANPLVKVTIVPRGKALGAAWYLPEERQITTKEQILDEMCSALGGRASEEINFGKISTGALNDLEKVTKQAYAMVSFFGMSDKVGNRSFYDSTGQSEYSFNKPYSEKTAEMIDEEANLIIEEQYKRALETLRNNQDGLTKLAELLLEREVIFTEDLEGVFGKRMFGKTRMEEIDELNKTARAKNESKKKKEEEAPVEPTQDEEPITAKA